MDFTDDQLKLIHVTGEKTVFDVHPDAYPLRPWSRALLAMKNARTAEAFKAAHDQLSQWFNYGFTVDTFVEYSQYQIRVRDHLQKRLRQLQETEALLQ